MVPRQPHRQTKDDHITTDTPQGHRPSSISERNLIILQVNINGIKTNWRRINTHNTELQMVKVHINNTKHITIANNYYLLETAHPRTTKQLTQTYNTAYSTSQTYHT